MHGTPDRHFLYILGDLRVNEHHGLTAMHTVWLREHNRVATKLRHFNPHWHDEKLFQEARRIVIAEMQHITYNEWLPIILGRAFMDNTGLTSLDSGYSFAYFGEVTTPEQYDPRVANAFATAAFRFGHSLIPAKFKVQFERRGIEVDDYRLRTAFFQPTEFREDGANNGDISKYEKKMII